MVYTTYTIKIRQLSGSKGVGTQVPDDRLMIGTLLRMTKCGKTALSHASRARCGDVSDELVEILEQINVNFLTCFSS
jgi:hypothetical protein